jgi:hypothetical protein
VLDDALSYEGFTVYHFASFIVLLDTANVNGKVLNMVDVTEAGELRKTTSQRGLTTFEAVALSAARTRLLTVQTTTSGLAGTGCGTATYALAAVTRTLSGLQILKFHVFCFSFFTLSLPH